MEMPAPAPRHKRNEPDAPRLSTRSANADIRPAVRAGVAKADPVTRRTSQQVEDDRLAELASEARASEEAAAKVDRVAALEDKLRRVDKTYTATANHPVDEDFPATGGEESSDSDGDDPRFNPASESAGDEDDSSSADDESDPPPKSRKKTQKPRRNNVDTVRKTKASSGTPAASGTKRKAPVDIKKQKAKKAKLAKKAGLLKSPAISSTAAPEDVENALMLQYGGPALDDDAREQLERRRRLGKAGRKGFRRTIVPVTIRPRTKKEQRGNSAKWTLDHLPRGTAHDFTNHVVPLARELAGTLGPWATLTVLQLQGIVNIVYKQGLVNGKIYPTVHKVIEDGVWYGLICYCLTDWRAGFATQAAKVMDALINTHQDSNDDDEDPAENGQEPAAAAESDEPAATTDAPTPEGRAEFATWALTEHEGGTMAFHWKNWGGGVDKQGFFASYLINYMYAYHLSVLDSIPEEYTPSDAQPYGALLLAVRAVQRNLQFWTTGTFTQPRGLTGQFSSDNWADIKKREGGKKTLTRCATKFLSVLQGWSEARWEKLYQDAVLWKEKKRRTVASSRGTSEAEDVDEVTEDEDGVVVLSD
ncbi:hypothetical protein C8R43DRAFT_1141446 [Mycena crocata]|nr:hypothetical protein C8R43DRAFT_1141446 [Mycena crocata]